ncbi:MAG TPA: 50S ribosomal protein L11 methyltransferase [Dehalococcoidia bacterium]|nr:50S ribosomal protein L11 methyltransferase [Dehalococcoidia bacterium]
MDYIEIIATVAPADVEPAAGALRALTGRDVWIETAFTQPDLECDAVIDSRAPARVHAYARPGAATPGAARAALAAAGITAAIDARTVAEEDWAEAWKEHFHVERFGERIVVVPSWRAYDPSPTDAVVRLDPGMAFGTGQHETTRMCLQELERAVRPGAAVLDAGCGSGILSLAAARLGAASVLAVDIDADCARITAENARDNRLDAVVTARAGSLGPAWPFDAPADGCFDVVVANIIARVIVDLASPLVRALKPGATLIVSGIIAEREPEVAAAIAAAGAPITTSRAMGDWRCLLAVRAGAA